MAYTAIHRHARISARKVRPLADLIRGKRVDEALAILKYQPQRGARMLEKVLKMRWATPKIVAESRTGEGVAHAGQRRRSAGAEPGGLRVVDARVDGGPMFKRCGRGPAAWRT